MNAVWLILETSGRSRVGVAVGGAVVGSADLGGGRQHNRQLIPTIGDLLRQHGLTPRDLTHIAAGTGPGSYTGLRVGLTAAKTLAYTLGCSLVAVPTFAAVAADVPGTVDVFADALQGTVYVQRFTDGAPMTELRIEAFEVWVSQFPPPPHGERSAEPQVPAGGWSGTRSVSDGVGQDTPSLTLRVPLPSRLAPLADLPQAGGGVQIAGPGVVTFAAKRPPHVIRSPITEPSVDAVFRVAQSLPPLTRDDLMRLEPLYLRGSSAEEKAKRG